MRGARVSPLVRFAAFSLLAVVVPAIFLAVLGYHSLRQWQRSADELFREQSRSMAVMVADKVDMALRHAEYGVMGRLEAATRGGVVVPSAVEALLADTPLIARLALFDREGRLGVPDGGRRPAHAGRPARRARARPLGPRRQAASDGGRRGRGGMPGRRGRAPGVPRAPGARPGGSPARRPRGGARRPRHATPRGHRPSRPAGVRTRGHRGRGGGAAQRGLAGVASRALPARRRLAAGGDRPPGHAVHGRLRPPPAGDRRRAGGDLPAGPARDRDRAAQGGVRRQRLARPQDPALPDPGVRGDPRDGSRERRSDAPRVLPGDHAGERASVAAHRERARLLAHRRGPPHLRPRARERGAARPGHRRELRVRAGPARVQGGRGDPARLARRCPWTPTRWARRSGT